MNNKDFILSEIRRYVKETGKIPTYHEFDSASGFISGSYIRRHYGKWSDALRDAGYNVVRRGITYKNETAYQTVPKYLRRYTSGYIPPMKLKEISEEFV